MKTLKNKILMVLVMLLTLSMVGLGVFSFNSKNANADTIFAVTNGAEIRLDGNNGMRFVTEVSKSKIKTLKETYEGAKIEYGTFVMPADFLEAGSENYKGEATIGAFFGEGAIFCWGKKVEGKQQVIHIPALLSVQEEGDVDLIKGSVVGIKDANLAREYTGIAYIKVTPVDGEPIYELATAQEESISMINLATDSLDNDKIVSDNGYKASVMEYINQYKTATGITNVKYTVKSVYGDKVVSEEKEVEFGLKTAASNVPADSEGVDSRYFYFNGEIANKTARADGSTVITVDFTAKTILEKSVYYGKYVLNSAKDGKEENTADLSVTLDNEDVVVIPASDIDLTLGNVSNVVSFGDTYVANIAVTTASNVLMNADDLKNWVRLTTQGGGRNWGHGDIITLGADIDATDVSIYYYENPYYHETSWGFSGVFDGNGHTISNLKSGLVVTTNRTTIKNLKLVDCKTSSPFGSYITSLIIENCEVEFDATGLSEVRLFGGGLGAFQSHANSVKNTTFTVKNATDSTKIVFAASINSGVNFNVTNTTVTTNAGKFVAINDQISDYDFTGAGTKTIESATFNAGNTLTVNTQNVGEDATLVSTVKYATGSNVTASVDAKAGYKFKGWYNGEELVSNELSYSFTMPGENVTLTAIYQPKEKVSLKANYSKYILNENKDGRVENTADLTVSYAGENYVVTKAEIATVTTGNTFTKVITETEDTVVMIEVLYADVVFTTAEEFSKITYLGGGVGANTYSIGYAVLANDIDMTGITSITLGNNPYYASTDLNDWGFRGTLDGQGYTIYNSPVFALLISNLATIKNLGWVGSNRMSSYNFSGTLDNVYMDIVVSSTSDNTVAAFNYISNTAKINNSIIKVNNIGTNSAVVANTIKDGATFTNSYFVTNAKTGVTVESANLPIVTTLSGLSVAQANNFKEGASASMWDFTNGVTFKGTDITEKTEAWGKYVLNEDKTASVANTASISYNGIEISNADLTATNSGAMISANKYAEGKYTRLYVKVAEAALRTKEDVENMVILLNASTSSNSMHGNFVLANDIDMLGASIKFTNNPYYNSYGDLNGWGFNGTFDGNGYTLYNLNTTLFRIVSKNSTIKNLGISSNISASSVLAQQLFGKVENCFFDIKVVDTTEEISPISYYAVNSKFSNTIIRIENDTTAKVYGVGYNLDGATFANTYVYTTDPSVGFYGTGTPASAPVVNALAGGMSSTDLESFIANGANLAVWDFTESVPKFEYTRPQQVFLSYAYAMYLLNETKDGRVENTADLTISYGGEDYVVSKDDIATVGLGNVYSAKLLETKEEIVYVNIRFADVVINNADDLANWVRIAGGGGMHWGHGTYIMLGADIDATGVSVYYHQNPGYHESGWGFTGTFDGNGHTISNFDSSLIALVKNTTIKNLKLVNCTTITPFGSYMTGFTLENCEIEIDASKWSEVRLFANTIKNGATIKDTTFVVKNAKADAKIDFAEALESGTLTVTNVTVTFDNGTFNPILDGRTTEYDKATPGTVTIANATFAPLA